MKALPHGMYPAVRPMESLGTKRLGPPFSLNGFLGRPQPTGLLEVCQSRAVASRGRSPR